MTDKTQYAVIIDTQYYAGDVQHPRGWSIKVASISDETGETTCIGNLDECQEWLDALDSRPTYLGHNEASYSYRIVRVEDDDADYQSWLDGVDWDGCPDGDDYDTNCAWAEQEAYDNNGILPIANNNGRLILIDLAEVSNA